MVGYRGRKVVDNVGNGLKAWSDGEFNSSIFQL